VRLEVQYDPSTVVGLSNGRLCSSGVSNKWYR